MLNKILGIVGLGYVGLPLAVTFGQKFKTIGFDIKKDAVENNRQQTGLTNLVEEARF